MTRYHRDNYESSNARDLGRRNLKSCWKTALYHRFGGELWWKLFIACGRLTEPMVRPRARRTANA
eukprot:1288342-Alexandrium_andersonii.AAC.1